ncbi:MAG TPA: hypothetical protein VFZ78_12880 [Flavisolibacter sp.]
MIKRGRLFMPVVLLFILMNALFLVAGSRLRAWNADQDVLIGGNLALFLITILSFFVALRGLHQPNPNAFVRSVYSSMMIKLFLCAIAVFAYVSVSGESMNRPALFTCMGLYLVYTFIEVSILMKLLRNKPHEKHE